MPVLTDDVRIDTLKPLLPPAILMEEIPLSEEASRAVVGWRAEVANIISGKDDRLVVVVGPCSIHDPEAGLEYARRLKTLLPKLDADLKLVMRTYFEKPRTTVGWKGLINDPDMDDSFHIEKGIAIARNLLLHIAELGLPAGTEALDPIMPQYLSELITWTAIGARTTESQTHREMASGLSTPVGFKNGTDGGLSASINALQSVRHPHHFLGITQQGQSAVFRTRGNMHAHIVLRGGGGRVNYDAVSIALAERELTAANLPPTIVVDCSHGNSNKEPSLQPMVAENCVTQIVDGNRSIVGLMLESHLKAGNQPIPKDLTQLEYGVSITDPCIDWTTTETLLLKMHQSLQRVRR